MVTQLPFRSSTLPRYPLFCKKRGSTTAKVVLEDQAVKVWQEKGKPMRGGKPKKKWGGGADSSSSASSSTTSSSSSDSDESEDRKASKAGPNITPRKHPNRMEDTPKDPCDKEGA